MQIPILSLSRALARNEGGEDPLQHCSPPLEKCVGHSLKLLGIV